MNVAAAVSVAVDLLQAATQVILTAQTISNMIQKAQLEKRELTPLEWEQILSFDNVARNQLVKALEQKV